MKKLVVYYSLDGNTAFIAKTIAEAAGADLLELKPKDEPDKASFMKYFWGGKQVMMKQKPELMPLGKKPQDYDFLFIGSPVWAFSYAPALGTFFDQAQLKGKRLGFFCCSGGMKGKVFESMEKSLAGNQVIDRIHFAEPLKRDRAKCAQEAAAWAKKVIS